MKEFVTAIEQAEAEDSDVGEQPLEFAVDGFECKAYRPGDGQIALLMATQGRHTSKTEKIAGAINFFASVLDDDAQAHIAERLLDRRDPYGVAEVEDIIAWMMEEWSGRPTKPSSGSTRSRKRTGPKSTAVVPAST